MRIVHFAISPLAGAPIRLCQALNAHTDHEVRLVDRRRYGTEDFGQDVVFSETPELAIELAEQADIIHFHNYLYYDYKKFAPIDFEALRKKGTRFVRQYHSHPHWIANAMGISPVELIRQDIPTVVISQFQERMYPDSYVIPNFVPLDEDPYQPYSGMPETDVFFCPTRLHSAWADRWNTKGNPETLDAIITACKHTGASWKLMHKTPLPKVLNAKQRSRIIVDEMVTGSYHLSGLEGLAQGKPVLSFLDQRSRRLLDHFSGSSDSPFINIKLEQAIPVLEHLLEHPEDAAAVGHASRQWMEQYWQPSALIQHLNDAYAMLMHDPTSLKRQPELAISDRATRFFAFTLPNIIHEHRKSQCVCS